MSHPIELGFNGGAVVRLTLDEARTEALAAAIEGGGHHRVDAEEGHYVLNLDEVVYLRIDQRSSSVGFSSG